MLTGGQIEPSDSPWASPVVLVMKKDGSTRFCVDYRWLNSLTVKDAYPLPRIDDSLRLLGNQQWFSTMDLASGYWQVAMSPEAKRKAAFITNEGLFQFRVMPFGLCNAPATFERLMDRVLCGMRWSRCLVYLDDVISFGNSVPEALGRLEEVLARLSDFVWGDEQQTAFDALKACLLSAPILGFPTEKDRFVIDTDASLFAIGGFLSHKMKRKW